MRKTTSLRADFAAAVARLEIAVNPYQVVTPRTIRYLATRENERKRRRYWVAEIDGEIVGCVFLVKKSKTIAKLRLLLVEPSARGLGIGKRLVDECLRFARQVGYKKMVLWTQSELPAARHIYQQAGFRLLEEKPHRSWGRDDLVSQIWSVKL